MDDISLSTSLLEFFRQRFCEEDVRCFGLSVAVPWVVGLTILDLTIRNHEHHRRS